jgi:ubiquinol-cytochrome c reductase cytochrome c1 subunit
MQTIGNTFFAVALAFCVAMSAPVANSAGNVPHAPEQTWSFSGLFGTFDRSALRRGFEVYSGACAGCHGLRLVAYRNLMDIGFSEKEVKAIASEVEVPAEPNDDGEIEDRPGLPADRFKSPFNNENAARAANGGALPPDLSLIVKARPGGANYIHGVLAGYKEPPTGIPVPEGMYYNAYFAGNFIAMPSPLSDEGVEYSDKTEATVAQQAKDIVTFLSWASEPELEERKRMGIKVILFLLVLTGLLYVVKRRIWADVH